MRQAVKLFQRTAEKTVKNPLFKRPDSFLFEDIKRLLIVLLFIAVVLACNSVFLKLLFK